jgi:hypothetical protein
VLVSVALIAVVSHALGWSTLASLTEDVARARFRVDFPEVEVAAVEVASDGRAALVWFGTGCGLVFVVGDRFATRKLRTFTVTTTASGLRLGFEDFGTEPIDVAVASPVWRERLGA